MTILPLGLQSWERTIRAVELVKDRLLRDSGARKRRDRLCCHRRQCGCRVGRAGRPVGRALTQDVDLLILRCDLDAVKVALSNRGFIYRHVASVDLFLDGPDAKARDAVHIIFAGERMRRGLCLASSRFDRDGTRGRVHVVLPRSESFA